ncbi:hypothetical protein J7E83_00965 [Arthrobacter sp. ISL-48]|uniref:hypothetical protein n=1 Tax=Arthrobacter sp. ISL-48 TaxID=2819110 RepID=UPI001BEA5516|nr:hypothetical protein [Arthrobacter sp. ISL-48]MBT2530714.1 hypothetical protein [Arthrobacter sp. ISL-48]
MTRSPYVLRAMLTTAAAAVLAVSTNLSGVAPANAETSQPPPPCGLICLPVPAEPQPEVPHSPSPKPTSQEPSAPVKPPTQAPAPPRPPAADPVPPPAQESSDAAFVATPSPDATATPSTTASTAGPSAESNWNKPITKSAKASQAAAISTGDGPGFGNPGLLAIMAGVLLVGLGGLAFAWWSRNRHFMH